MTTVVLSRPEVRDAVDRDTADALVAAFQEFAAKDMHRGPTPLRRPGGCGPGAAGVVELARLGFTVVAIAGVLRLPRAAQVLADKHSGRQLTSARQPQAIQRHADSYPGQVPFCCSTMTGLGGSTASTGRR